MPSKNSVNLEGRLSKFDVHTTTTNRKVAKLVLSVYQSNGKGKQPDYVSYNVTHWNPDANTIETLNKLITDEKYGKSHSVEIIGFLKREKFQTKDGQERWSFGIIATKLLFNEVNFGSKPVQKVQSGQETESVPF